MTSGDGQSPETAFLIGGAVPAEPRIMHYLGITPTLQALRSTRGCSFDVLSGEGPASGQHREIYFKLGPGPGDPGRPCVLQPANH
jgi:hypothetical protein